MRILILAGFFVLTGGSSCLDSNTILPGQLGQITDAAAVPCTPYPKNPSSHQCLILANPYNGLARVFDMTDNQYVLSPIGYLPLAIRMGVEPQRVASVAGRVFTLDPVNKTIYEIPSSFVSPKTGKTLTYTPNLFVVVQDADQKIWAFVSDIQGRLFKEALPDGDSIPITTLSRIDQMGLDVTGKYLWLILPDSLQSASIDTLQFSEVAKGSITAVAMNGTQAWVARTDKTFALHDPALQNTPAVMLEAPGVAIYVPTGTYSTCCNGKTSWVAVLLANGKLQYYPFANNQLGDATTYDIHNITGVGTYAFTNPVKLIGAQLDGFGSDTFGCARRLYVIYSGGLLGSCEGMGNIKRIDQTDF